MRRFATIGVYGFDQSSFIDALHDNEIDMILDVRQRRGVRGSQYAFANAARLQKSLQDNGIGYRHYPELAPTTELRHLQYTEDERLGFGKRNREALAQEYVRRYTTEVLDQVDLAKLVMRLPANSTSALLCVEAEPVACHRGLIAARFEALGIDVVHVLPG